MGGGSSYDEQERKQHMEMINNLINDLRQSNIVRDQKDLQIKELIEKLVNSKDQGEDTIKKIQELQEQLKKNQIDRENYQKQMKEANQKMNELRIGQEEYKKRHAQLEAINKGYFQEIEKHKKEMKDLRDPELYKKNRENSFKTYIENVKFSFKQKMPKKKDEANVVMLGKISSGKSSLLNKFYNLNLQYGIGETTRGNAKVVDNPSNKVRIWDCPGVEDDDYSLCIPEQLLFFYDANLVLILYSGSIKEVKDFCFAMHELKPNETVIVRTKCDLHSAGDNKSLAEEVETDMAKLKEWGIAFKHKIYCTSAKEGLDFKDNKELKNLIDDAYKRFAKESK